MINDNLWLDKENKRRAFTEIDSMKIHIGASDIATDLEMLDNYYFDLQFNPNDSYRRMEQKYYVFRRQKDLSLIFRPEDTISLKPYERAHEVGAFYIPSNNLMSKFLSSKIKHCI
jgi:predicted metalloendopeptidase